MLRDDIAKYTELTGDDGAHVPIIKLGAFLDGYEKGSEEVNKVLDEIKSEIPKLVCCENEYRQALVKVADVIKCIDKYRAESEG